MTVELLGDPLEWALVDSAPLGDVRSGNPETAERELTHGVPGVEVGVWEVSPGVFHSYKPDITEYIYVLEGAGRLVRDGEEDQPIEIIPNTVITLRPGASFMWYVEKTLRKFYVILPESGTSGE